MAESSTKLQQWQQKIDQLSQRERILLLASAAVLVVMLMQVLLIDPLLIQRDRLTKQSKDLRQTIQVQAGSIQILEAELQAGIDRQKIKQRDRLQRQLEDLNADIQDSIVAMIPPQLMAEVLEQLLAESKGLKLVSLVNKPVVAVVEDTPAKEATKNDRKARGKSDNNDAARSQKRALYNHSFVLQLQGDYPSAVEYFERLSKLPWRFYWDSLNYEVNDYPTATITLEVHTVSMSEEWIGV